MTNAQPLPSMFGRFTAILQEHKELSKTLRLLAEMCTALEGGDALLSRELSPKRLLGHLQAELAAHFLAEESPAYFGTVMEEAPALVPKVGGLKWEHATMLHAVDSLCKVAAVRPRWPELAAPTRELIADLERHEQAESALLRQLFKMR